MRVLLAIANFLIGAVMLVASMNLAFFLVIAYLKLTGGIVEGRPMYRELGTPLWGPVLAVLAGSVAIIGLGYFLQRKLRQRLDRKRLTR